MPISQSGSASSLYSALSAALLWSCRAEAVIGDELPSTDRLRNAYWLASHVNCLHWQRLLAETRRRVMTVEHPGSDRVAFAGLVAVQVEALSHEPLHRVVSATACRLEALGVDRELAPVLESVLAAHKRLRQQCWQAWGGGKEAWLQAALEMHRLQCLVERWSDWMVAQVCDRSDLSPFAFEPHRLTAYQRVVNRFQGPSRSERWDLASAQLFSDLQSWEAWSVQTGVDTDRLIRAALGLLPPKGVVGWDTRCGGPASHQRSRQ